MGIRAAEENVYRSEFSKFVQAAKWSHTRTDIAPGGSRVFLGAFGGKEAPLLRLAELPEHKLVRVKMKLFLLGALDGNNAQWGPDRWAFAADGRPIFSTTFSNVPRGGGGAAAFQSFPDEYPGGSHGGLDGASEVKTLGFQDVAIDKRGMQSASSVYDLEIVFAHHGEALRLQFGSAFTEPIFDERWGLESVEVSVLDEPVKRTPEELAALWKKLSGGVAIDAHRAIWSLAETGTAGVEMVAKEMEALGAGVPAQVQARAATVVRAVSLPKRKFSVRSSAQTPFSDPGNACDGKVGEKSAATKPAPMTWEKALGTSEWLECRLPGKKPKLVSSAEVFWFQSETCALPQSWRLEYLDGTGKWLPVKAGQEGNPITADSWNKVTFDPVETAAIRLHVHLAPKKFAGVSEFRLGVKDKENKEENP